MPVSKNIPRRQCIPIIYTRGTHYDVGYDVVSSFLFDFLISHNETRFFVNDKTLDRLCL